MSIDKQVQEMGEDPDAVDVADEDEKLDADSAPIIKLLNLIIGEAVRTRASDIHIEPMADRVRVRYRIDGVCIERDRIPKRMQAPVTARLKIMSGIKIEEKRLPQDGRIKLTVATTTSTSACPRCRATTARASCCEFCAPTRSRSACRPWASRRRFTIDSCR